MRKNILLAPGGIIDSMICAGQAAKGELFALIMSR